MSDITTFELKGGVCGYHGTPVISGIDFSISSGEVLCILGPNGVGKSTLFSSILRLLPMIDGKLTINGEDIAGWTRQKIAQTIGYIPQSTNPPFSYTVMDVVLMGRTAHLGAFASPGPEDIKIASDVIDRMHIRYLANKKYLQMSGGEKQLALIARALAQQPKIMIMDEPTAALDYGNQQLVLEQVHHLAKEGMAVIMSSHFPDHAFLYAHKVLMLRKGSIYAYGTPQEVITEKSLDDLYGVTAKIIHTGLCSKVTGTEIDTCIPL